MLSDHTSSGSSQNYLLGKEKESELDQLACGMFFLLIYNIS